MASSFTPLAPFTSFTRVAGTVLSCSGLASAIAPFTPSATHMPQSYLIWMLTAGAMLLMAGSVTLLLLRTRTVNPAKVARRPVR